MRRVVGQVGDGQLVEGRLRTGVRVLAAHPDRDPGLFLAVDLHRRAGRVAGATGHAFLLVDLERGLAVDHRGANGRDRAAGHDGRALANVGDEIVVDARRLGVLHVHRDVALAATVDLAARGGDPHAVGHLFLDELTVEHVHQRFHHAGSVGAGNVAVQPALGVRDHRHRSAGAAHREAFRFELLDQRGNFGFFRHHELDVGAGGEAHMAFGQLIADIAELADREHVHLALGASAHGPDLVTRLRHVVQNAGTRAIVPVPVAVVGLHHRVHVRERIRDTDFIRHAGLFGLLIHAFPPKPRRPEADAGPVSS